MSLVLVQTSEFNDSRVEREVANIANWENCTQRDALHPVPPCTFFRILLVSPIGEKPVLKIKCQDTLQGNYLIIVFILFIGRVKK